MICSKVLISVNELLQSYQMSSLCNVTVGQNSKNQIKKYWKSYFFKMEVTLHLYKEFLFLLKLETGLRIILLKVITSIRIHLISLVPSTGSDTFKALI